MAGYLAACCVAALSQLDWLLLVVVAAAAAVVVVVVVDDVGTTLSIAVNCAWRSSFVFWLLSSAGTGEGVAPYETSGVCVCVRGILYGCFRAWGAAGPLISSLASWRPHSLQDAYQLAPVTSKKPGEKTHTHTHTHTHRCCAPWHQRRRRKGGRWPARGRCCHPRPLDLLHGCFDGSWRMMQGQDPTA